MIYFLIYWFHLSQVKTTYRFGNQPVEFRNSLTIRAVIFEREDSDHFFSVKLFWKLVESLSFVIIQTAAFKGWSWINSWSFLAWFEAWRKWFVVGWVVLSLRFNLSQALCVCLVVFQVCKRVLVVLVWFLCDSRVFYVVFAYFESVRVDTL